MTWLLFISLYLAPALAKPAPEGVQNWEETKFGWSILPAVNFNTDEGFGAGALLEVYRFNGNTRPYKWRAKALFFLTTKGIHSHYLAADALELFGGKWRLTTRVKFEATNTGNYCGVGNTITCDL